MECPQECPVEMYTLMRDCWHENPEERPSFRSIFERVGKILENSAAKVTFPYMVVGNRH